MTLQTLIPLALKASILLNVFAIGLRASLQDATYLFRRPGQLVRALLAMNLLMPLFAVALAVLFDLNPAVKIALVALSVSPIPPVLPIKMMKAGGTKSYSIGVLVAAGLLAILFVPAAMEILQRVFGVPLQMTVASIAALILKTVLLPLALGIVLHSFVPALAERLAKPISQVGSVGVLGCGLIILFTAAPHILALIGSGTLIALAAFVLVGLAIGHWLGGQKRKIARRWLSRRLSVIRELPLPWHTQTFRSKNLPWQRCFSICSSTQSLQCRIISGPSAAGRPSRVR